MSGKINNTYTLEQNQ